MQLKSIYSSIKWSINLPQGLCINLHRFKWDANSKLTLTPRTCYSLCLIHFIDTSSLCQKCLVICNCKYSLGIKNGIARILWNVLCQKLCKRFNKTDKKLFLWKIYDYKHNFSLQHRNRTLFYCQTCYWIQVGIK